MKRAARRALTLALAGLLLCACSAPRLTRHYQAIESPLASASSLTLSVFMSGSMSGANGDEEAALIANLSERGQAELIRALAARGSSEERAALLAAVKASARPAAKACAWADTTTLTRRMTITLLGDLRLPADRIEKLQIDLQLQPAGARGADGRPAPPGTPPVAHASFVSWDRFDTRYASYDLGTAKATQTSTVGLKGSRTDTARRDAGSLVRAFDPAVERVDELEESMKYSTRRLDVGGALYAGGATLVQEGAPYINLLGSSSAAFTLKMAAAESFPVHRFSVSKDGTQAPTLETCLARFSRSTAPLMARITGKALLRAVVANDATLGEGDDTIRYSTLPLQAPPLEIVPSTDLFASFYGLALCPRGAALDDCQRLYIENADMPRADASEQVNDEIKLSSPAEAAALRRYLLDTVTVARPVTALNNLQFGLSSSRQRVGGGKGQLTALSADIVKALRVVRLGGNGSP